MSSFKLSIFVVPTIGAVMYGLERVHVIATWAMVTFRVLAITAILKPARESSLAVQCKERRGFVARCVDRTYRSLMVVRNCVSSGLPTAIFWNLNSFED